MNKWIVFLLPCFFSLQLHAQPKGYTQLKNIDAFRYAMATSNKATQTISSDFSQIKNMSLLADKIKSSGKFYFKKEDKVRIEYTTPFTYLLVMNSGQIMVKDEQKSSRINTRNSKTMQSVNRIMIDCMSGNVFSNPDFKVTAYENTGNYLLAMVPANESMKKMFQQIDVFMDKKKLDVNKLVMTETGGDLTEMDFTNTQHNKVLADALFKVK